MPSASPDGQGKPDPDDVKSDATEAHEARDRGVPHDPDDDTEAKGTPSGDRLRTETATGRPDDGDSDDDNGGGNDPA